MCSGMLMHMQVEAFCKVYNLCTMLCSISDPFLSKKKYKSYLNLIFYEILLQKY